VTVHIVLTVFYPECLDASLRALQQLELELQRRGARTRCLLVSNNQQLPLGATGYDWLKHDNTGMEFGAYQAGLDRITWSEDESDVVLFVNDTLSTHHVLSRVIRSNLSEGILRIAALSDTPAICGEVDVSARSFTVRGLKVVRWVSTWAFALNWQALQALAFRVYVAELDADIQAEVAPHKFFTPGVDAVLRAHLSAWLFGAGASGWQHAAPLSAENAESMARKARAIMQEKYLSARLEASAAMFSDIRPTSIRQITTHRIIEELVAMRDYLPSLGTVSGALGLRSAPALRVRRHVRITGARIGRAARSARSSA
jgi:hypothetical protein